MEITVKDLIDFLKQYPETTLVELDKNGWEESNSPISAIKQTGLFWYYKDTLIINN